MDMALPGSRGSVNYHMLRDQQRSQVNSSAYCESYCAQCALSQHTAHSELQIRATRIRWVAGRYRCGRCESTSTVLVAAL